MLSFNQLHLNGPKTKYIVSKPRNKPDDADISLSFDACVIDRVSVFKFLGVLFKQYFN